MGKSISDLMRRVLTKTTVDRESVEALVKGLQRILLQSDVDIQLVYKLSQNIRDRSLNQKLPEGVTLREHVTRIIYEEIVNLLGEKQETLIGKKRIMLVGLFGSGKTTSAVRLGRYLQKQGLKVGMIAADYHRPAAPQQLKQLGDQLNIPVHYSDTKDPFEALQSGLSKFHKFDSIIVDTAGRDALDGEMAKELKRMYEMVKPDEVLLVIPADIGRIAGKQAEEFHKLTRVTGVIITKTDGTAKGGGALSACSATSAKVKFIGVGEKVEDFEPYDPVRFVSRLLGMGDLQGLLERAKEAEFKEEDVEKIMSGKFSLQDFYDQISGMQKMGPLDQVLDMIPGMKNAIPENLIEIQKGKLKKYKYIIDSMTKEERKGEDEIHSSRIKRVAKGAGVNESEVREMLKQYKQSKKMIKKLGGVKGMKRGNLAKMAKKLGIKM
ncbi:MAG: signal recognition particle protein [Candidatus Aenigmarchaeota archaeon CG_4_10_14_0_8_um_filter_37_24]|nr:signal recognition particle protein [Candidatus Aenigmarchaeota archaeon]PIW41141.1 MAG: signal recognition particle protein [Candidatus Aenigmarchaeota archaeon CG15_BIG_FIL_POST_REV_8_21_14_020_37_27]PIX50841.1 MAG: signal recognition particle protein [Candidatus Aenigmarchaeota archaeon CG_4_8_14_3_um_filter_37_24]PIY36288.1 MAG: signal recognition particle protein [Candidatus Aenigmarchaeota archaeon CG_4_10_14_3_um_filter_37_21]PIZ35219.1 MAG: signal recognition particle protein [Candid